MEDKDSRAKLLEIATDLFACKGFADVSVRELTQQAKLNVSAVSYHFGGKEGLYQAVLEEQFRPIRESMETMQSQTPSTPIAKLEMYAKRVTYIHGQRPYLSRFIMRELLKPTAYGGPIVERHLGEVYQFVMETLREGMEQGLFRQGLDVAHAAVSMAGILNFYFITKPLAEKMVPLGEDSDASYAIQAFQLYLYGIVDSKTKGNENR